MNRIFLVTILTAIINFLNAQETSINKLSCVPGTIAGSVDVSPTGAATYQIPIMVSPGSKGMQPNLQIVYNSQSGNGLLGWGWNIAGLSSISRINKTKYYDGVVDAVSLTNNDVFALDGERLINSGTGYYYPANNPYLRVVYYDNFFTVTNQDGVIMEYGKEGNSLFYLLNSEIPITYSISRIIDADGNYIVFSYSGSKTEGNYRISEIKYTGNSVTNQIPFNRIVFEYEEREDVKSYYIAGYKSILSVRLNSIKVFSEGEISKEYEFTYHTDLYSKLNEIFLEADGVKFNSTKIRWGESSDYPNSIENVLGSSLMQSEVFKTDLNYDGLTDFARWNRKDSLLLFFSNINSAYDIIKFKLTEVYSTHIPDIKFIDVKDLAFIDVNSDGKDELFVHIVASKQDNDTIWNTLLKFEFNDLTASAQTVCEELGQKEYYFADINNDGIAERFTVSLGRLLDCSGLQVTLPKINSIERLYFVDFDGDRQNEMLVLNSAGYGTVWKYSGTTLTKLFGGEQTLIGKSTELFFGDFNSDGKTDLLTYYYTNSEGNIDYDVIPKFPEQNPWHIFYSTGNGFVEGAAPKLKYDAPGVSVPIVEGSQYTRACNIIVDDLNSDGFSDITQLVDGVMEIFLNNGVRFIKTFSYNLNIKDNIRQTLLSAYNSSSGLRSFVLGFYPRSNSIKIPFKNLQLLSSLNSSFGVNSITDGLSNTISFTYTNYSDNTVFSESFPKPELPIVLERGPFRVVDKLTVLSEGKTLSNSLYSYSNGYSHIAGLGFLGFKNVSLTETVNNYEEKSEYEYTVPGFNNLYAVWLKRKIIVKDKVSTVTNTATLKKVDETKKSFFVLMDKTTSVNGVNGTVTEKSIEGFDESTGRITAIREKCDDITITSNFTFSTLIGNTSRLQTVIKKTTNSQGTRTETQSFSYDASFPHRVTSKLNVEEGCLTQYSNYDAYGNLLAIATTSGGITRSLGFEYDNFGRFAVENIDILGNTYKRGVRPSDGALLWEEDPLGNRTTYNYRYNGGSFTSTVTTPDGNITVNTLGWDDSGNGLYYSSSELNGINVLKSYYSANGRKIKEEAAGYRGSTIAKTYEYNPEGTLRAEVTSGIQTPTIYSYYSDGRLKGVTGLNLNNSYSYIGMSETVTNNIASVSSKQEVNPLGHIQKASSTFGEVEYTYDPSGKCTQIKAGSSITKMEYDSRGNQTKLVDPNAGTSTYTYNGFNQPLSQTDANGQTINFTYDPNGLLLSKTGPDFTESFTYDETLGKKGRLISATRNGVTETYTYDNLGRLVATTATGAGKTFTTTNQYNDKGQLYRTVQPTGVTLEYQYDNVNNITHIYGVVTATGARTLIWEGSKNLQQQWQSYKLGEKITTKFIYDQSTLFLKDIISGTANNETSIHNLGFTFNNKGQLTNRTDGSNTESFTYDALNRLQSTTLNNQNTYTVSYADNGNISSTSLAGDYSYLPDRPNAVAEVEGVASGAGQSPSFITSSTFTSDNRIATMNNGITKNVFEYGPSGSRFRVDNYIHDTLAYSKVYVGSNEFIYSSTGAMLCQRTLINAPTGVCAVYQDSAGISGYHFVHTDYLGSWLKITDKDGNVENQYSYDAWGRPRNPTTWELLPVDVTNALANLSAMQPRFDRGYTGHEHMAGFGLINMNGRLYDPYLQRFLSPDIFVQFPDNEQSYNRYSYCLNNPMAATDPSGWFQAPADLGREIEMYQLWMTDFWASWRFPTATGTGGSGGYAYNSSTNSYTNSYGDIVWFSTVYNDLIKPNLVEEIYDIYSFTSSDGGKTYDGTYLFSKSQMVCYFPQSTGDYRANLLTSKNPIVDIFQAIHSAKENNNLRNLYDVVVPNGYGNASVYQNYSKTVTMDGFSFKVRLHGFSPNVPASYYDIYQMGFGYLDRFSSFKPTTMFNGGYYQGFFMTGYDRQYFITIGANSKEGYQYLLNLFKH